MRRLLLALLLLAVPAQAATSFNFNWRETWVSPITPAYDAGWEQTGEAVRAYLSSGLAGFVGHYGTGLNSVQLSHLITLPANSADQELAMQFISAPLAAGAVFQSGVTTVTTQIRMSENSTADDITQCITGIRIIDDDGTTVSATLLAVANYGTSTELQNATYTTTTNERNKTCANGDTVTASYTTVAGDYLVVEVGFQSDGLTDADPQAFLSIADHGGREADNVSLDNISVSACPANETDLGCYSVITFSNTITTLTEPNAGPTRLYLPLTEAAAVSPAISSIAHGGHAATSYTFWEESGELLRRRMVKTKGSSTTGDGTTIDMFSTADMDSEIDRQYVSDPMLAGITFTKMRTTVSAQIRCRELQYLDDVTLVGGVRIYSQDGTTLRATLLPVDFYQGWQAVGSTCATGCAAELAVTSSATNETVFKNAVVGETYTTVAGDRLVYEVGPFQRNVTEVPEMICTYGETDADCDTTDSSNTASCSPWIEFSNAIAFTTDSTARPQLPFFGRFL